MNLQELMATYRAKQQGKFIEINGREPTSEEVATMAESVLKVLL